MYASTDRDSTERRMDAYVAVATRGRAPQTRLLLDYLAAQTLRPRAVVIVGTEDADVEGLAEHPQARALGVEVHLGAPGLSSQRNATLDALAAHTAATPGQDWFVVFFDDDFRPDPQWLATCEATYRAQPEVVGITGTVLADGVTRGGVSEDDARGYLDGRLPMVPHSSQRPAQCRLSSLYGCNMSFRGTVAAGVRFDEALPLYSWQEDVDYSGLALRHGTLVLEPGCRGVHLGVTGGRGSGLRLGYSQIANPLYLVRKRTMSARHTLRLLARNIVSNVWHTVSFRRDNDYPGRVRGNLLAVVDLVRGRCRPMRILEL